MYFSRKFIVAAAVAAVVAAPLSAFAISPIGGKVISVVPSIHCGGLIVTVVGFGMGSGVFWYVPGLSIAYLYGPPIVGEWILGLSDIPNPSCGERITFSGTSPI